MVGEAIFVKCSFKSTVLNRYGKVRVDKHNLWAFIFTQTLLVVDIYHIGSGSGNLKVSKCSF